MFVWGEFPLDYFVISHDTTRDSWAKNLQLDSRMRTAQLLHEFCQFLLELGKNWIKPFPFGKVWWLLHHLNELCLVFSAFPSNSVLMLRVKIAMALTDGKPTFEMMQNKRRIAEPESERSLCWTVISKTRNTKLAFSGSEMASTRSSLLIASPRVVYPDSVWVVLVTTGRYESPSDAPDRVAEKSIYLSVHFRTGSK